MKYSVDASALIGAWRRLYPPDRFPTFWERLGDLIDSGDMRAAEEVVREIQRKDDELNAWVEERPELAVEVDDPQQDEVTEILRRFPRLLDTRKGRSGADPWVIALARLHGCAVVTQEVETGKANRPHIPDVCRSLGIDCIDVLELIRREEWSF